MPFQVRTLLRHGETLHFGGGHRGSDLLRMERFHNHSAHLRHHKNFGRQDHALDLCTSVVA